MNRTALIAIAVAAIAVFAGVGVGFAVTYSATTVSSGNTMSYSGDLVEIVKPDGSTLKSALPIVGPNATVYDNQVTITSDPCMITGYKLRIDTEKDNLTLRCWILLEDVRSWAIIQNVTLSVNNRTVGFLHDGSSSIPSSAITLAPGIYQFTFTITYKQTTITLNGTEDTGFLDLSGSRLIFVVGDSDPLPGVSGYEINNS